jgi:hypothetical protein
MLNIELRHYCTCCLGMRPMNHFDKIHTEKTWLDLFGIIECEGANHVSHHYLT